MRLPDFDHFNGNWDMDKPLKRRILQPLLMAGTILTAITVVAATLSPRPAVRPPENAHKDFQASDFQETLSEVNLQMDLLATNEGLQVAPPVDNMLVARRLSLALVGSSLSLEEYRALASVPEDQQIEWWTAYLLQDPRWADYFSERLARSYVGTDSVNLILFRRRKFRMWLADQLKSNRPYDEIVRTMISAEGLWTDTPQVNFVTATMPEDAQRADPIVLAGRTSRAFLAQRIDCLQCHDDFLGELNFGTKEVRVDGVQEHFHSLASFYSGAGLSKGVFKGIMDDDEPYKYKYLGADEESTVEPNVPFAPELLPENGSPRERLAKWITHPDNIAFSRATVNRVWALMFSRPLVEPIDNIPLDRDVPLVMDTLANDFANHGFDLKRLIRLIAKSNAFHRDSRAEFEVTPEHEKCWATFPLTQLRPEQVAGSVFQSSSLKAIDYSSSIITQLRSFGDLQDFLQRYGDQGRDEFDNESITISQRLIMMNGSMVAERTQSDPVNNAASRIANQVADDAQAVELMFLSSLNRPPSKKELNVYCEHLDGTTGNARQLAVGDILWAIINSTEFSWNH